MNSTEKIILLHNIEAEREVIAACLVYDNLWQAISPLLKEEYFTDKESIKAYGIMRQIEKEGKMVEVTDFTMRLMSAGGNISLFISDKIISYEVTKQRVELLRELYMKRKLYVVCVKGMQVATDPMADETDFQSILSEMNDTTNTVEKGMQSFGDAMKELRKDITDRRDGNGKQGMMTGLHIFDSRYGLHEGDLVIFAGRTSQGKSTLSTTIARNMALMNIPSAYYSLEMNAKQLTARIMARDALLSSSRMLYDKIADVELKNFDATASNLSNLPIYYDDKSKMSFQKLRTSIRSMVRTHGVKIVFIDYLQILANGSETNREQLIGDMARDLKRDAVELSICIIAISQLSRAKEKQNPEPTLGEMRGSGQIEEACDMAVLVYRPFVYGIERYKDGSLTYGTAQLTIAKGRNIGLAQEVVNFNGDLTYFYDKEAEQKPVIKSSTWNDNEPLPF